MAEELEILQPDSRHIGKNCIYCDKTLAAGDEIVECPRCHQIHHVDCWKNNGGCARRGCPQIAQSIVGQRPAGDGPPPPIPRKYIFAGIGIVLILIIAWIFWPKPPDPAAGRSKIYVLVEASFDEQEQLEQIVSDFNDTNEEIYIELQTSTVTMIENQLLVRMAAGDAPDIFALPYHRFESMHTQIGAMYPLGDESNPAYGVQHPSQLRVMSIFVYTEHPEETMTVFKYLLTEMPRQDLTDLKKQNNIVDPRFMLDIDTFLEMYPEET